MLHHHCHLIHSGVLGGMTVALQDVVLLKELLSPESIPSFTETDVIIQQMGAFHWARKRYCTAINVLAMALYRLFSAQGKMPTGERCHDEKTDHVTP